MPEYGSLAIAAKSFEGLSAASSAPIANGSGWAIVSLALFSVAFALLALPSGRREDSHDA